ncbi:MAG: YfhO family protein, partial [Candidatus Aenigmatarchaeota archaeon]
LFLFSLDLILKEKFELKVLKIILFLILILDLWLFWQKYLLIVRPEDIYEKQKIPETNISDIIYIVSENQIENGEKYRVYDSSDWTLPQYIAIRNGIELVNGYDLSIMSKYKNFSTKLFGYQSKNYTCFSKCLGLLNTKYIISHEKIYDDGLRLVYQTNRTIKMMPRAFITASKYESNETYVYENMKYLPRSFVVHNAKIVNEDDILDFISSNDFDPTKEVLITNNKLISKNSSEFKEGNITFYSPNKIITKIDLEEPGYLVLSENWYPGWKAYDNGNKTEVIRVNYILRAVRLDEGSHEVLFIFDPSSFRIGLFITLLTLILVSIFLLNDIIYYRSR